MLWFAVTWFDASLPVGMVRSALWLLREIGPTLVTLHNAGFKITVTGHSLGAGVATFVVYMLQNRFPEIWGVLYGCPSCVDAQTADSLVHRLV
jgi:acetyl esterase/lipase